MKKKQVEIPIKFYIEYADEEALVAAIEACKRVWLDTYSSEGYWIRTALAGEVKSGK